jgi:hypothetical protein
MRFISETVLAPNLIAEINVALSRTPNAIRRAKCLNTVSPQSKIVAIENNICGEIFYNISLQNVGYTCTCGTLDMVKLSEPITQFGSDLAMGLPVPIPKRVQVRHTKNARISWA